MEDKKFTKIVALACLAALVFAALSYSTAWWGLRQHYEINFMGEDEKFDSNSYFYFDKVISKSKGDGYSQKTTIKYSSDEIEGEMDNTIGVFRAAQVLSALGLVASIASLLLVCFEFLKQFGLGEIDSALKGNSRKYALVAGAIASALAISAVIYFASALPEAIQDDGAGQIDSFFGHDSQSIGFVGIQMEQWWGAGAGWFFSIISPIPYLAAIVLYYSRSENAVRADSAAIKTQAAPKQAKPAKAQAVQKAVQEERPMIVIGRGVVATIAVCLLIFAAIIVSAIYLPKLGILDNVSSKSAKENNKYFVSWQDHDGQGRYVESYLQEMESSDFNFEVAEENVTSVRFSLIWVDDENTITSDDSFKIEVYSPDGRKMAGSSDTSGEIMLEMPPYMVPENGYVYASDVSSAEKETARTNPPCDAYCGNWRIVVTLESCGSPVGNPLGIAPLDSGNNFSLSMEYEYYDYDIEAVGN
ncbi:MAG: hypothetical protein PHH26_07360 [Candidatus Thermoplasmatota archaeon]|nr:hypothetical protein [Candidatus Thermoplasmatota archaeon]